MKKHLSQAHRPDPNGAGAVVCDDLIDLSTDTTSSTSSTPSNSINNGSTTSILIDSHQENIKTNLSTPSTGVTHCPDITCGPNSELVASVAIEETSAGSAPCSNSDIGRSSSSTIKNLDNTYSTTAMEGLFVNGSSNINTSPTTHSESTNLNNFVPNINMGASTSGADGTFELYNHNQNIINLMNTNVKNFSDTAHEVDQEISDNEEFFDSILAPDTMPVNSTPAIIHSNQQQISGLSDYSANKIPPSPITSMPSININNSISHSNSQDDILQINISSSIGSLASAHDSVASSSHSAQITRINSVRGPQFRHSLTSVQGVGTFPHVSGFSGDLLNIVFPIIRTLKCSVGNCHKQYAGSTFSTAIQSLIRHIESTQTKTLKNSTLVFLLPGEHSCKSDLPCVFPQRLFLHY